MKQTQLSKRLNYIAEFITPEYILADIGTDHGFVPIHQVLYKGTPKAYAMDINEGPLERAREHIEEEGLVDKIETRLSDGMHKLEAGEAESILIAGMGGALMVKILTEGREALSTAKELVLSPHTEADMVRGFIKTSDFVIDREGMVYDAGKYYVVMHIRRAVDDREAGKMYADDTDATEMNMESTDIKVKSAIRFGKLLIKQKDNVFVEFLEKELNTYKIIADGLKDNKTEAGIKRKEEITELMEMIKVAL